MNRLLKPLAVALALVMVMVILPVSVKADTSLSISNVTALVDQGNMQVQCNVTVAGALPAGATNASINVENYPDSALGSSSDMSKAITGAGTYTLYYPIRSDNLYNDNYTISFVVCYTCLLYTSRCV